jgi:diguanylate cyclase (GGDEF)-like protein
MNISRVLRPGLKTQMRIINLLVVCALIWLSYMGWHAARLQDGAHAAEIALDQAVHASKEADMLHDAVRGDVLESLLVHEVEGFSVRESQERVNNDSTKLLAALGSLSHMQLAPELKRHSEHVQRRASEYTWAAKNLVALAGRDRAAAVAQLDHFDKEYLALLTLLDQHGKSLNDALLAAGQTSAVEYRHIWRKQALISAVTVVLISALIAGVFLAMHRRLEQLTGVAAAIDRGNLAARSGESSGRDEISLLGIAINKMADSLDEMFKTMRRDARKVEFGRQLAEALDMADREHQIGSVAARAMAQISPEHAMELLLADSSRATMTCATAHPSAGPAGCAVNSPYDCVAVRRGTAVEFSDGEALNACRHLRDRACGSVSAVCVPVTFMGRAVGVLHAAGPVDNPLQAEQVQQLNTLGTQVGMRIGTVRAFEKTQIEASTDSLTGLSNRRATEQRLAELLRTGTELAFVMCDLDHFKALNDKHGHAAGDNALRTFAECLKQSTRGSDIACRWGGEEFAIVMVGATGKIAEDMIGRLRKRLATTLLSGKSPHFSASFGIADTSMRTRLEDLVNLADVALYSAKAQGRNRACLADPNAESQAQRMPDSPGAAISLPKMAADANG